MFFYLKIRIHKGASKRFKKNGSGEYKHKRSHCRHILTKKSSKRKRNLRGLKFIDSSQKKVVRKMFFYS